MANLPKANYTRTIKQGNLNGVGASQTATGKVTPTGIHHGYKLVCLTSAGVELTRAEMIADISNIRVFVDGELKMNADITFFLDRQKYYGDAFGDGNVDGIVPLMWTRRNMASHQERALYAIGMNNNPKTKQRVSSITVEADIIGVVKVSTIELYLIMEEGERDLGQHICVGQSAQSFATTGDHEIESLPKNGPDTGYIALHVRKTGSATISKVTTKVNFIEVDDRLPNKLHQSMLAERNRAAQTAYYHVDFAKHDDLAGFIPMAGVTDFRQIITWATDAPDAYTIFTETLHGLKIGSAK